MKESESQGLENILDDEDDSAIVDQGSPERSSAPRVSDQALKAQNELRIHELLALLACFVFPILGAWLLHAIRAQLSRPSESLISDYNLTIFLLASEVRPLSHLIKLVQRRTLFLQRSITVATSTPKIDRTCISDLSNRLEELEAHVANSVTLSNEADIGMPSHTDEIIVKASSQANAEVRKTIQPEVDALNRAMRRYEKRTMTSAIQIETRLQELEGRVQDAVILAAATQRNADKQAGKYTAVLMNWISGCIVVPARYIVYVLTIPQRTISNGFKQVKRLVGIPSSTNSVQLNQKSKAINRLEQKRKSSKERGKA